MDESESESESIELNSVNVVVLIMKIPSIRNAFPCHANVD
jgi:hypothetical protein